MTMREDYYQLLDVEKSASAREIRASYRRLVMQLHPDHSGDNPVAEERFKLICEAWRILKDPRTRADYDDWLERHERYSRLPELAEMPQHRARVSARHGEQRKRSRGTRHYAQPMLLRRGMKIGAWQYVGVCALGLLVIVPVMVGTMQRAMKEHPPSTPPGAEPAPLPLEKQKQLLSQHLNQVRHDAETGDSAAQFRYGNLLNTGIAALDMPPDREAAMLWWERAAARGYKPALLLLQSLEHSVAAPISPAPAGSSPDEKKSKEPRD